MEVTVYGYKFSEKQQNIYDWSTKEKQGYGKIEYPEIECKVKISIIYEKILNNVLSYGKNPTVFLPNGENMELEIIEKNKYKK